jgi:hypothetical protein
MATEPEDKPQRKRLNADQRRERKAADIQLFAKQYARPAQKGIEPNDRRYRRDVERQVKQMRPEELDILLRDEE